MNNQIGSVNKLINITTLIIIQSSNKIVGDMDEYKINQVLNHTSEILSCIKCGTKIRYGDYDCPHCGHELDDQLREWAIVLLNKLNSFNKS